MDIQPLQMLIAVVCEASPSKSHSPIHKAGSPACSQHRCTHDFFFLQIRPHVDFQDSMRAYKFLSILVIRSDRRLAPDTVASWGIDQRRNFTGHRQPKEPLQARRSHPEEKLHRAPRAIRRRDFTGHPEPVGGANLQGAQSRSEEKLYRAFRAIRSREFMGGHGGNPQSLTGPHGAPQSPTSAASPTPHERAPRIPPRKGSENKSYAPRERK
jgi:hypothetical protein